MTKIDDAIKLCTQDTEKQAQFYELFLNSLFYVPILEEEGITFSCDVEVGKDITIKELRKSGYNAFYVAIGAQKGQPGSTTNRADYRC